jgi:hypothetical protein
VQGIQRLVVPALPLEAPIFATSIAGGRARRITQPSGISLCKVDVFLAFICCSRRVPNVQVQFREQDKRDTRDEHMSVDIGHL